MEQQELVVYLKQVELVVQAVVQVLQEHQVMLVLQE